MGCVDASGGRVYWGIVRIVGDVGAWAGSVWELLANALVWELLGCQRVGRLHVRTDCRVVTRSSLGLADVLTGWTLDSVGKSRATGFLNDFDPLPTAIPGGLTMMQLQGTFRISHKFSI